MTEDGNGRSQASPGDAGDARLPAVEGIPDFWDMVRSASHRCLVLDYDGTIAPFRTDRMSAKPLPGVVDLLIQIRDRTDTYLAMMSGRPISELLTLMGDLFLPISGSQGTEFRMPDGTTQTHVLSDEQEKLLALAEEDARGLTSAGRIERKISSVGLHTRGVDAQTADREEEAVCRVWTQVAEGHDLECRRFKGGVELRLLGIDKGTAILSMLRERPTDSLCVYVGDDVTDEDAFRALKDRGYGIKVGGPDEPTDAVGRLADPAAVKEFLITWLSLTTEN